MNERKEYPEPIGQTAELNEESDPLPFDPVIEVYKKHVDRTILRENLKLTPQQRSEKFLAFMRSVWQMREAGEKSRNP
jgi:hypothetical protein